MAYITRNGATGYPATGATVYVYSAGTTTAVTGLLDLDGVALSNPITVPADDFWGFEPASREKLDVYWDQGGIYLIKNAILKDPYQASDVTAIAATSGTATGIKETEPANVDGTGGTATLNFAAGNVQVLNVDDTACTISPSNWPTTESGSMTLIVYVATAVHGGANWTAFTPQGNAAPDLTAITHTTGYGIYEILWADGKFWWFTVEEV